MALSRPNYVVYDGYLWHLVVLTMLFTMAIYGTWG